MLCEQIPELEVVKAFNSPLKFCAELPKLDFDICILDIEMPDMNGLQVANLLNGRPVIFTTAYKEYAADAFDLNAVDYVRKPLTKERLEKAVKKASMLLNNAKETREFFHLNTDKGKAILFFNQILYLYSSDVDSRDKIIVLQDGSTLTAKNYTFSAMLKELPYIDFCRINKKELIALKIVRVFSFDEITTTIQTTSGKNLTLTLSEAFRKDFLQKVNI